VLRFSAVARVASCVADLVSGTRNSRFALSATLAIASAVEGRRTSMRNGLAAPETGLDALPDEGALLQPCSAAPLRART